VYATQELRAILPQVDGLGLQLLESMLQMRPEMRCSAHQALAHPWFAELNARSGTQPSYGAAAVQNVAGGQQQQQRAY
jgi:negative regulator of PHO system